MENAAVALTTLHGTTLTICSSSLVPPEEGEGKASLKKNRLLGLPFLPTLLMPKLISLATFSPKKDTRKSTVPHSLRAVLVLSTGCFSNAEKYMSVRRDIASAKNLKIQNNDS